MTSVRFLPVAEQYPSRIATSSLVASHLTSGITQRPKKIPIQPEGQTGKARVSHRRRETTLVASGGFLGLAALVLENIRTKQAQVHQACLWDAVGSPLGNGTSSYPANLGYLRSSAQRVNDFCIGHEQHLSRLRFITQAN